MLEKIIFNNLLVKSVSIASHVGSFNGIEWNGNSEKNYIYNLFLLFLIWLSAKNLNNFVDIYHDYRYTYNRLSITESIYNRDIYLGVDVA